MQHAQWLIGLDDRRGGLDNLGEAELPVLIVELDVVGAHEHVTEDVQRAGGCGHIEAGHREEALRAVLERIVLLGQHVLGTRDRDGDVRSRTITRDRVLLIQGWDGAERLGADGGGVPTEISP